MTAFAQVLIQYGDDAVIYTADGQVAVKAFIQPMLSKTDVRTWRNVTRLGEVNTARYYYFGPCSIVPNTGACIECCGQAYSVVRAEKFRVGGRDSHVEAILTVREEEWDGNL